MPAKENPGGNTAGVNKVFSWMTGSALVAAPAALGAEHDRGQALVLDRVGAGRTCAVLGKRQNRAVERCLDPGVDHVDRKPEPGDREPVVVRADLEQVVARIASDRGRHACQGAG